MTEFMRRARRKTLRYGRIWRTTIWTISRRFSSAASLRNILL